MSQTFPEPEPELEPTSSQPPMQRPAPTGPQLPRPDWRGVSQTSLAWMEQSQRITAKFLYDLGAWIFGGLLVAAGWPASAWQYRRRYRVAAPR